MYTVLLKKHYKYIIKIEIFLLYIIIFFKNMIRLLHKIKYLKNHKGTPFIEIVLNKQFDICNICYKDTRCELCLKNKIYFLKQFN